MSVSYFVRYEGEAESPAEFLDYYRERHVPILMRFPGIRRIVLHTPVAWQDESEARSAARGDFGNFPPFRGLVFHQAARSEEVFSK